MAGKRRMSKLFYIPIKVPWSFRGIFNYLYPLSNYCCKTATYYNEKEVNPVRQVYQKEKQRGDQRTIQAGKETMEEREGRVF